MKQIDTSIERQKELKDFIKKKKEIYKFNYDRIVALKERYRNEISNFELKFYKKLYKNIPISLKDNNDLHRYKDSSFTYDGNTYRLCKISLTYDSWLDNPKYYFDIDYSSSLQEELSITIIKLKFLNTIFDRLSGFEDEFFLGYKKIKERYNIFIHKYDARTPLNEYEKAEQELEEIQDRLLIVLNTKYIFTRRNILFTSVRNRVQVKEMVITKLMKVNCEIQTINDFGTVSKNKIKISTITNFLKNHDWNFDLNMEREIKLNRILKKLKE